MWFSFGVLDTHFDQMTATLNWGTGTAVSVGFVPVASEAKESQALLLTPSAKPAAVGPGSLTLNRETQTSSIMKAFCKLGAGQKDTQHHSLTETLETWQGAQAQPKG